MRTDLFVAGLGTYLPETVITVEQAVAQGLCAPERRDTGALAVHVAGDVPAPDLAIRAVNQAVCRSGVLPDDVSLLVHASVHHQAPEAAPQYIQGRTLGDHCLAVGLGHTCNGVLVGLELATSYLHADPSRGAAVVCAADNFGTPLFDRWTSHPDALYSDAASAIVLSRHTGFARLLSVCSVSAPDLVELTLEDDLFPPSWTLGKKMSFAERLDRLDDDALLNAMSRIRDSRAAVAGAALDEASLTVADISRVTHQATSAETRLAMFLEPIGFRLDQGVLDWCQQHGQTAATAPLGELDHLVTTGAVGPGENVLVTSNGPGMVFSSAVVQIATRPSWSTQ